LVFIFEIDAAAPMLHMYNWLAFSKGVAAQYHSVEHPFKIGAATDMSIIVFPFHIGTAAPLNQVEYPFNNAQAASMDFIDLPFHLGTAALLHNIEYPFTNGAATNMGFIGLWDGRSNTLCSIFH
jgi:hypothetical protein